MLRHASVTIRSLSTAPIQNVGVIAEQANLATSASAGTPGRPVPGGGSRLVVGRERTSLMAHTSARRTWRFTLGAFLLGLAIATTAGIALYLVVALIRSIQMERRKSGVKRIWANFGLSILFCSLFFLSWVGQGVAQWQTYIPMISASIASRSRSVLH